ncbi:hypothetical protein LINPERHAP1_LOCUS36621 [Linum perenne]
MHLFLSYYVSHLPVPESADGPVLNLINKEQEEVLRSKPSVVASIEKLRQPLSVGVSNEINIATLSPSSSRTKLTSPLSITVSNKIDIASLSLSPSRTKSTLLPLSVAVSNKIDIAVNKIKNPFQAENEEEEEEEKSAAKPSDIVESMVRDLLNLLYFGALFDVKLQNHFHGHDVEQDS